MAVIVMGFACGLVFGLFLLERANNALGNQIRSPLGHSVVHGNGFVMSTPIRRDAMLVNKKKPYANYY